MTARTNSGDDEPEGNPNNIPDVDSIVADIVGDIAPSEWGQNVTDQILELKVGTCAVQSFKTFHAALRMNRRKRKQAIHSRALQC